MVGHNSKALELGSESQVVHYKSVPKFVDSTIHDQMCRHTV